MKNHLIKNKSENWSALHIRRIYKQNRRKQGFGNLIKFTPWVYTKLWILTISRFWNFQVTFVKDMTQTMF